METVDAVRRRLDVEVPAVEVSAELERAYEELRRTANVRGFRPGRAPRQVLERLFGDRIRADVFSRLVQDSYEEALRDHNLEPVGRPEIVTESAKPGEPLRYSATVEVQPTVVASNYKGLEIERPVRSVTEKDVDEFLEKLQQSYAQLHPIDDRMRAEVGDVATVDFEARSEGRLLGRGEGRTLTVEREGEDISVQLRGVEVGSTIEFDREYAPDHPDRELAGRKVSFRVTLRSLARKEVPELDDDFAKDHGEVDTLAALRERIRERLERAADEEADGLARSRAVEELLRRHDIQVPEAMADRRAQALVEEVIDDLGPRRPPAGRHAAVREQLHSDLLPRARDQVKAGLILDAIAAQEGLQVDESELEEQIERFAARAGKAGQRVRQLYQDASARAALRARLLQDRALAIVMEGAAIREVEISGVAEGERNG